MEFSSSDYQSLHDYPNRRLRSRRKSSSLSALTEIGCVQPLCGLPA